MVTAQQLKDFLFPENSNQGKINREFFIEKVESSFENQGTDMHIFRDANIWIL